MPSAPPVLPPDPGPGPRYQPTLLDRLGPDGPMVMRARVITGLTFVVSFPIWVMASRYRELTAAHPYITGFAGAACSAMLMYVVLRQAPQAAADAAMAFTAATGKSTPYEEQFSYEESLAARGDVPAALAAFERVIAERPAAVAPRLRAAELYAGRGGNPRRAAELFREIRRIPGVTNRDSVYASSRLVDLYDGALDDPGRALVELRRIIELHPGSAVASHARAALPGLKARLAQGGGEG